MSKTVTMPFHEHEVLLSEAKSLRKRIAELTNKVPHLIITNYDRFGGVKNTRTFDTVTTENFDLINSQMDRGIQGKMSELSRICVDVVDCKVTLNGLDIDCNTARSSLVKLIDEKAVLNNDLGALRHKILQAHNEPSSSVVPVLVAILATAFITYGLTTVL